MRDRKQASWQTSRPRFPDPADLPPDQRAGVRIHAHPPHELSAWVFDQHQVWVDYYGNEHELLGDPPTLIHPKTRERHAVPLDKFADRDPDAFFMTISFREYNPAVWSRAALPAAGEPIIELDE